MEEMFQCLRYARVSGVIRTIYRGPLPPRVITGTIELLLQERP